MFRATIHTSFVVDNVIRLTRDDLDGAAHNPLYPKDFFIDLIFTDARNQSNLLLSGNSGIINAGNGSYKVDYKKINQLANSHNKVYPPEEETKGGPEQ
jgi:hypothetical protein